MTATLKFACHWYLLYFMACTALTGDTVEAAAKQFWDQLHFDYKYQWTTGYGYCPPHKTPYEYEEDCWGSL